MHAMISLLITCPPEIQAPSGETENLRNLRLGGRTWFLGRLVSVLGMEEVTAGAVDSTLWPEWDCLEMNCFLGLYLKLVGNGMPFFLGIFLLLIESLKDVWTYTVLVPRGWHLLITVSLASSEMGIRLVSGKYQEKVLPLCRLTAIPFSFPLKKGPVREEPVESVEKEYIGWRMCEGAYRGCGGNPGRWYSTLLSN